MDINGKMAGKNVVSEALAASRKYETQNEIDKNERPLFHVTPPVGWMNDPNGFIYYKGKYLQNAEIPLSYSFPYPHARIRRK